MRKRKGRIVHGGSPRDTRLPDEQDAKLPAFIDSVEELVRLGIRKGLSMKQDGTKLDSLVKTRFEEVPAL